MLVWVDNYAYSDLFSGHTLTHVYACSRKFFNGSSARFSLAQTERTLKDFGRMKKFCSDSSRMRDCFVVPLLVIFFFIYCYTYILQQRICIFEIYILGVYTHCFTSICDYVICGFALVCHCDLWFFKGAYIYFIICWHLFSQFAYLLDYLTLPEHVINLAEILRTLT